MKQNRILPTTLSSVVDLKNPQKKIIILQGSTHLLLRALLFSESRIVFKRNVKEYYYYYNDGAHS